MRRRLSKTLVMLLMLAVGGTSAFADQCDDDFANCQYAVDAVYGTCVGLSLWSYDNCLDVCRSMGQGPGSGCNWSCQMTLENEINDCARDAYAAEAACLALYAVCQG